jgi:hypothetical protein
MSAWAEFVTSPVVEADVVPLRPAAQSWSQNIKIAKLLQTGDRPQPFCAAIVLRSFVF